MKKLPTVKELQTEYAKLLADKKEAYAEYRQARAAMRELLTVRTMWIVLWALRMKSRLRKNVSRRRIVDNFGTAKRRARGYMVSASGAVFMELHEPSQ